jgi:hypothetical protein
MLVRTKLLDSYRAPAAGQVADRAAPGSGQASRIARTVAATFAMQAGWRWGMTAIPTR